MTAFCRKSGGVAVALLAFLMGASRAAGGADNPKFWGSYKTQEPLEGLQVARRLSEVPEELAKRYPPSRYDVYAIDLDGTHPTRLTSMIGAAWGVTWHGR